MLNEKIVDLLVAGYPDFIVMDAIDVGMGNEAWSALRLALSRALRTGSERQASLQGCLIAQADAVPARVMRSRC